MLGIYCYVDKKDNLIVYVGKDSNIEKNKRDKDHYQHSNYNKQPLNRILQNNPNRYTYQVLVFDVKDEDTLNALEIQYIRQLQPKFNFTDGGDGVTGYKHTEEARKKMSEVRKDKKLSEKHKENLSKAHKGRVFSEETCKKISKAHKGKKHSDKTKEKISKSQLKSTYNNTTGFLRVSKVKRNCLKQGFEWRYSYKENDKVRVINSVDLDKLKEKVLARGLEWREL